MFSKSEIHCIYCQCPKDIWKPSMKTYQGDECKLLDDFLTVIWELEESKEPFNNQDIINKCRSDFEANFNDIEDFEATISELIETHFTEGYMPRNYRHLSVI